MKYDCNPSIVLQVVSLDEFLDFWVGVPLLSIHFVAANVKKMIGEELRHFAEELVEKLVGFFTSGIESRIEDAPFPFDFVGARAAGKFRIADKPGRAVAGHVEFGNHADAAVAGILDQVVNFVLRVVETVGTHLMELRKFLALDAETLIFGEVPVEDVHLHGFEAVDVSFEHIERDEMARGIDHQPAPGKARLIVDGDRRGGKSFGRHFYQLKKSLQTVQRAERSGRAEFRAGSGDFEDVRLIFAKFLDFLAGMVRVNHEDSFGEGARSCCQRNCRLPGKLAKKALDCTVKPRLRVSRRTNGKLGIHHEPARANLDARGNGHQIDGTLLLRLCHRGKHQNAQHQQTETSHRGASRHVFGAPF